MIEIVKFYFGIVGKFFEVYLAWEIFPGVSFLAFLCAASIMTILLSVMFQNIKDEYDHRFTLHMRARRANEFADKRSELRGVKNSYKKSGLRGVRR